MSHAAELLARRREEALDPAEDLYLREHLAGCAECRELDRSIVRAERLIADPAPAIVPAPMAPPRARVPVRAILVGALTVVLVVTGAVAGNALRERRSGQDVAGPAPAFAASVPDLPPDWSLEIRNGLLFAVPANWDAVSDARDREIGDRRPQVGLTMIDGTTIGEVVEGVRESGVLVSERAIPADRPMHSYATRSSSTSTEQTTLTEHVLVQIDERTIVVLSVPERAVPGDSGAASPDAATLELVGRSLFVLQDTDDTGTKFTEEEVVAALRRAASLERSVLPTAEAYGVYAVNGDRYSFAHVRAFADRATRQRQDPNLTTIQSIADWLSPVTFRGIGNVLVMVGSRDVNVRYRLLRALDSLLYPTEVVPTPTPQPPPATLPAGCGLPLAPGYLPEGVVHLETSQFDDHSTARYGGNAVELHLMISSRPLDASATPADQIIQELEVGWRKVRVTRSVTPEGWEGLTGTWTETDLRCPYQTLTISSGTGRDGLEAELAKIISSLPQLRATTRPYASPSPGSPAEGPILLVLGHPAGGASGALARVDLLSVQGEVRSSHDLTGALGTPAHDGSTRLAYWRRPPGSTVSELVVWDMAADTTRVVFRSAAAPRTPIWSAGRDELVFVIERDQAPDSLVVVDVASAASRELVVFSERPTMDPIYADGRVITGYGRGGAYEVVDARTGRSVSTFPTSSFVGYGGTQPSRDGMVFDLETNFEAPSHPLYVWRADAPRDPVAVVDTGELHDPVFRPGKTELLYADGFELKVIDYGTGRSTAVHTFPRTDFGWPTPIAFDESGAYLLVRSDVGLQVFALRDHRLVHVANFPPRPPESVLGVTLAAP